MSNCDCEDCRARRASFNQPSPLVKAEALALSADNMPSDRDALQKMLNRAYYKGNQDAHYANDLATRLGLLDAKAFLTDLDSAFEAEFDLLPEDAKPLCDTFYRSLRKRLGHPVECSGKSSGAASGGRDT